MHLPENAPGGFATLVVAAFGSSCYFVDDKLRDSKDHRELLFETLVGGLTDPGQS
jgi:hypothetical protein